MAEGAKHIIQKFGGQTALQNFLERRQQCLIGQKGGFQQMATTPFGLSKRT